MSLTVTTPTASYDVVVAPGLLDSLPARLAGLGLNGTAWLVADAGAYVHYGATLEQALRAAGRRVETLVVPAGEPSKSLVQLSALYDWLIGGHVERRDVVLALGGGVVGDLAGFAAASVLRGIAVIQLPTTLLAMVDAAVGGKTGINHPLGKNLIGAFHHPRLVLADTATLATLPARELRAGWAEVVKHGVIRDAGLFDLLEQSLDGGQLHEPVFSEAIRRAVAVKVGVVSRDEHETGERMLLNYGHTIGHALETWLEYGTLLHGEAVAIGMQVAGRIATLMGLWSAAELERQGRLLAAFGLPVTLPPEIHPATLIELTLRDKKVQAGRVRWVLPTRIGDAIVHHAVPNDLVAAALQSHMQKTLDTFPSDSI